MCGLEKKWISVNLLCKLNPWGCHAHWMASRGTHSAFDWNRKCRDPAPDKCMDVAVNRAIPLVHLWANRMVIAPREPHNRPAMGSMSLDDPFERWCRSIKTNFYSADSRYHPNGPWYRIDPPTFPSILDTKCMTVHVLHARVAFDRLPSCPDPMRNIGISSCSYKKNTKPTPAANDEQERKKMGKQHSINFHFKKNNKKKVTHYRINVNNNLNFQQLFRFCTKGKINFYIQKHLIKMERL